MGMTDGGGDHHEEDDGDGSDWDEIGYFSSVLEDAEDTGKNPKFFMIPSLNDHHSVLDGLTVNELVKTFRDVRDQLATDRKGYKAREAQVKTHLHVISMLLLQKGDNMGVESFSTPSGTAYKKTLEKMTISDWTAFVEYVQKTGNFHVLQKRVSPNAAKEIRDTDGALPAGVTSMTEISFAVRSPTARKKK